ncbi:MAG: hypothetical protein HXY26_01110 [Hydrogenophilaceae bacterium]|nr:hypothetical protein [Hydrogenophilaceae bacterium]
MSGATVEAGWNGTNAITGTLTGTEGEGVSGKINGAFFGPGAHELGGNWAIDKSSDSSKGAGIYRALQPSVH